MNKLENEAVILAAGQQTRYKSSGSKLLMQVEGKPAFSYTLDTLLQVFPEELLTVVTSHLFEDFNDYLSHHVQKAQIKFDDMPGSGTVNSLRKAIPLRTNEIFVSEANIFFEPSLIVNLYNTLVSSDHLIGVIGITSDMNTASTHRHVRYQPELNITGSPNNQRTNKEGKNIGAYFLRSDIDTSLQESDERDLISHLNSLNISNHNVGYVEYFGTYLHIENQLDSLTWRNYFNKEKI